MEYHSATNTAEGRFFSMIRLTCFVLFICSTVSANKDIVVTTSGPVRGKLVCDEITGTSYCSYLGIPYAEAPCGELRYRPPVPKKPWKHVFDATKPGPVCPQREEYYTRDQMSEDCLTVNVFVPANRTSKLMPVICNIHGGNFDSQSGNPQPIYGPQLILQQNIVVVTFNYRLGAMGFLSMCNEEISGNAGLKDVVLMLQWLQKNIKKFGGDPKRITLSGQGASGAICGYLMLMPQTKNLFNNAIIHSGSVLSAKYQQLYPRQNLLSLARVLNIKCRNNDELIKKLKSLDVHEIVKATETMIMKDPQRGLRIYNPFMPTVETPCKHAVVKESMLKMIQRGCLHDKPLLCGFNDREGLELFFKELKEHPNLIDKFNENHGLILPAELQYPKGSKVGRQVAERIWDKYMGCYNISTCVAKSRTKFISFMTDRDYAFPVDLFVKLFTQTKKSPVYYFLAGVDTELNYGKVANKLTLPGCARGDDLGYWFLTEVTKSKYKKLSPAAKKTMSFVLKVVSKFAECGKPSGIPGPWPSAGKNRNYVGVYNSGREVVRHRPYPERMDFWYSIYNEFFNYKDKLASFYCTNDDNYSVRQSSL